MSLAIYRFTLAEVVGRKVVTWGLVASAIFLALFAVAFRLLYREIVGQSLADDVQQALVGGVLTVLGLYVTSFLAAFLAMSLAAGSVSADADSGVLQAIVVRPLRRWQWYLGRWAGFSTLIVAYVALMTGAMLLIAWSFSGYRPLSITALIGLMSLQVVFLLTVGMLISCRLSTLATGVVLFFYFGIAWLSGFIGFIGQMAQQAALTQTATAVSLVAPSDALWKAASHFAAPRGVPLGSIADNVEMPFMSLREPSALFLVWTLVLTVIVLASGVRAFGRRDL